MADNIISSIVTFLTANWNDLNTDDVTPFFSNIGEVKRVGGDTVLMYNISEIPSDNASGAQTKKKSKVVALDCRSTRSYDRIILIKEEIERLFNNNQIDPFGDQSYDIQDITDLQDMSDITREIFRYKILVKFEQFNKSV